MSDTLYKEKSDTVGSAEQNETKQNKNKPIQVVKRNGKRESLDLEKINKVIY